MSIDIFCKVRKNIFFDILLGQVACSILLGGRRSGFLLLGSFPLGGLERVEAKVIVLFFLFFFPAYTKVVKRFESCFEFIFE